RAELLAQIWSPAPLPSLQHQPTGPHAGSDRRGWGFGAELKIAYRIGGSSRHECFLCWSHSGERDRLTSLRAILTANSPLRTQASTTTGSHCHTISAKLL